MTGASPPAEPAEPAHSGLCSGLRSSRSGSRGADVRPHSSAAPRRLVRERPAAMGATDARSRSRARLSVGALTPTARSAGHRRSDRAQALSPGPGRRGAVLNGGQHSRRRVHGRHRHHRDGLGAHPGPLEVHGAASLQGFPVSSWRGVGADRCLPAGWGRARGGAEPLARPDWALRPSWCSRCAPAPCSHARSSAGR